MSFDTSKLADGKARGGVRLDEGAPADRGRYVGHRDLHRQGHRRRGEAADAAPEWLRQAYLTRLLQRTRACRDGGELTERTPAAYQEAQERKAGGQRLLDRGGFSRGSTARGPGIRRGRLATRLSQAPLGLPNRIRALLGGTTSPPNPPQSTVATNHSVAPWLWDPNRRLQCGHERQFPQSMSLWSDNANP